MSVLNFTFARRWRYNITCCCYYVPSVSLRAVLMSSSLVMCLCSAPSGMVGMAVWLTDVTVAEEVRVELDCAAAAAAATFDGSDGGSSGLHGECEPAEVLDEAANGTPDDE